MQLLWIFYILLRFAFADDFTMCQSRDEFQTLSHGAMKLIEICNLYQAEGFNYSEVNSSELLFTQRGQTNNFNNFNQLRIRRSKAPNCDLDLYKSKRGGHLPCDADMKWVCSKNFKISVCVDTEILVDAEGRPRGNMSRNECEAICKARGKRLLTNDEWLTACNGTDYRKCPVSEFGMQGRYAREELAKVPGSSCYSADPKRRQEVLDSGACMSSPELTRLMPKIGPECVSEAGVIGCVGSLGQWVSTPAAGGKNGMFNGGFFGQKYSSVAYTTVAHGPNYSDYSIGCRCGANTNP